MMRFVLIIIAIIISARRSICNDLPVATEKERRDESCNNCGRNCSTLQQSAEESGLLFIKPASGLDAFVNWQQQVTSLVSTLTAGSLARARARTHGISDCTRVRAATRSAGTLTLLKTTRDYERHLNTLAERFPRRLDRRDPSGRMRAAIHAAKTKCRTRSAYRRALTRRTRSIDRAVARIPAPFRVH